jgi:hypothetical protein
MKGQRMTARSQVKHDTPPHPKRLCIGSGFNQKRAGPSSADDGLKPQGDRAQIASKHK